MAELAPQGSPGAFKLGFAGDTFNTAWYLARISPEISVSFATALGDDRISQDMRAFMRESRIKDTHVQTIAGGVTGLYLIHLDEGERSFSYWRDSSAARQLARDEAALAQAMTWADLIYFSGITMAILDTPSRGLVLAALGNARAAGKVVVFDTNLRPRLWSDTAEMNRAVMEAAALCDIALPSFEDEAVWFGDTTPEETLDRYSQAGVPTIVVKNGGGPVVFQHEEVRGRVDPKPVNAVVDTTAAGDSFNAGVIAEIMMSGDLVKGISLGCHLAGQVVKHKGALVPIHRATSLEDR